MLCAAKLNEMRSVWNNNAAEYDYMQWHVCLVTCVSMEFNQSMTRQSNIHILCFQLTCLTPENKFNQKDNSPSLESQPLGANYRICMDSMSYWGNDMEIIFPMPLCLSKEYYITDYYNLACHLCCTSLW